MRQVCVIAMLFLLLIAAPGATATRDAWAANALDQRIQEVGKIIEEADLMYAAAKKGHLPSVQVINELYAKMTLARSLFERAREAAETGQKYDAGAHLDAAEFLARRVYDASKH